jgi:hypothetical protein
VEVAEAEVLHLGLDAADAEPVGDRREDVEGLAGDRHLALAAQEAEGAHVVQPVRELDEDHPHVVHRGEQQAAEVLGLGRLAARVRALEVGHLGQRDHQAGHLRPEGRLELVGGGRGVLEDVVQQPRGHRLLVELHLGEDPRHRQGVGQVGLAGAPHLPWWRLAANT